MEHPEIDWLTVEQYGKMPAFERGLNWAGLYANQGVREIGWNAGPQVERFLASVGLGKGYAWCAAFCYHCLKRGGAKDLPKRWKAAGVRHWVVWAEKERRLWDEPRRGDLFFWLNENGSGHIGFVRLVRWKDKRPSVLTIEGNTNPGGSREGDGVYRKTRLRDCLERHHRHGFISLEGV